MCFPATGAIGQRRAARHKLPALVRFARESQQLRQMFIVRRNLLSNSSSRACHSGVKGSSSASGFVGVTWDGGPRSRPSGHKAGTGCTRTAATRGTARLTAQSGSGLGAHAPSGKPSSAMITLRTTCYRKLVLALSCTRNRGSASNSSAVAANLPRVCLRSPPGRGAIRPPGNPAHRGSGCDPPPGSPAPG